MTLNSDEAIGILDVRSLGYYKIDHTTLQQNLSNYQFENLNILYEQFNEYNDSIKALHKSQPKQPILDNTSKATDPYPLFEISDIRRHLTDEQILEQSIDMDIIMKYKAAFSLRDKIGEFPNITKDTEVKDKSPFFIWPLTVSKEDTRMMDWQM